MKFRKILLNLAGGEYFYIFDTVNKTVYTQEFPGIPVERVHLTCKHSLNHDQLAKIIETKIKVVDSLIDSF